VDRYSFTVTDFHRLPPAGLPGAPRHNENLADVSGSIEGTTDLRLLRGLIGRLLHTTREIERVNQKFEVHLKESKQEINQL
jgi:hypothetical protein